MSDYTDNNKKTEWKVNQKTGKAVLEVDHGDHIHKLDLTKVPVDEITKNPNQYYGDAHRASDHYKKEEENNQSL